MTMRCFFKVHSAWLIDWGDMHNIASNTEVIIIAAPDYIAWLDAMDEPDTRPCIVVGNANMLSECYSAGCDHYIKEPWSMKELYYTLQRYCRQIFTFCLQSHLVEVTPSLIRVEHNRVAITPQEYKLLRQFILRPHTIINKRAISATLFGATAANDRLCGVYIHALRTKLYELLPRISRLSVIKTIPREGYMFCPDS